MANEENFRKTNLTRGMYLKIALYIEKNAEGYINQNNAQLVASIVAPFRDHNHDFLTVAFDCAENSEAINEARYELLGFIEKHFRYKNDFGFDDFEHVLYFEKFLPKYVIDRFKAVFDRVRYSILLMAFVVCFLKQCVGKRESFEIHSLSDLERLEFEDCSVFRGQSNENWRLVPSALRGESANCVYDLKTYRQRIDSFGLKRKYEQLIQQRPDEEAYFQCAFLQHACSFSPLIDFSKSKIAAVSFSLSNTSSFGEFHSIPSALFVCRYYKNKGKLGVKTLNVLSDIETFLEKDLKIYNIYKDNLCFGEEIRFENSSETIVIDSLSGIIDKLMPRICFIDHPTNDRMKYQKGLFLCFYGCINLGGRIFYELSPFFEMIKLAISPTDKNRFLLAISKDHPEFDSNHILNPYLIFREGERTE